MSRDGLARLISPRSICLIGAGEWTDVVAAGSRRIGFQGELWRVHPNRPHTDEYHYYRSIDELPAAPDATFLAVPRQQAPLVAGQLAARGAGGFVCFASGFAETGTGEGRKLSDDLLRAAGDLPFFGPNCYGTVNFFDRAAMWPDQVVGEPVGKGVALICQSGTIALTLMFNARSVPVGLVFTVGNQLRLTAADLIERLCDDTRVTAFGLYLEGLQDAQHFARAADRARLAGKPIALIKAGRTAAAARTVHTHTGSLAGADAVFDTFCREAGIARCDTLATLCETLKLFHSGGPLPGRRILVMGASGGDMAMTADVSRSLPLEFPAIPPAEARSMQDILTERVTIANPLDIQTHLWFRPDELQKAFAVSMNCGYDAVGFMLDNPPEGIADTSAFDVVIDAFIAAAQGAPSRAALIASLPETISPGTRHRCLSQGVVPLQGQREALEALAFAGLVGEAWRRGALVQPGRPPAEDTALSLTEDAGKAALAQFGLSTARRRVVRASEAVATAAQIGYPVVMKAAGGELEHKSEVGGVILNIRSDAEAGHAAQRLGLISDEVLVEEMITDGVAEVLIGITVDAQFGQVLVLGSGGVLTELWQDSHSLLPPWSRDRVDAALGTLKVARLLDGFRGKPRGDRAALLDNVMAVAAYARAHESRLLEIDVNPLIVRPEGRGAVAVDALIRLTEEKQ